MTKASNAQGFTADEAIAIFEDSISYYMPETPVLAAETVESDDASVAYYEAA